MPEITSKKTFEFFVGAPEHKQESVTVYVSNMRKGCFVALAFNDEGKDLQWSNHYAGILQLKSKKKKHCWYIYLSAYWDDGMKGTVDMPIEKPLLVIDQGHEV